MSTIILSAENFESEVLKSDVPVVVDFYADWCGPCKMIKPIFEEISDEMDGSAKFGKLDIDDQADLAAAYNVMSIPTMLIFKGGEVADKSVGAMPKDSLINFVKKNL